MASNQQLRPVPTGFRSSETTSLKCSKYVVETNKKLDDPIIHTFLPQSINGNSLHDHQSVQQMPDILQRPASNNSAFLGGFGKDQLDFENLIKPAPACKTLPLRSLVHCFAPNGELYKPTIKPTPGFSANADAEHLKKAMHGLGTNEQAIIDILGRRTSAERVAIRDAYEACFKKSLHDRIKSELSGNFQELALMLIQSPFEVMADALYNAMKGAGTKERILNELLASCTKDDIEPLKKAYSKGLDRSLEKDIQQDTSGDYCKALLLILAGQQDEPTHLQLKKLTPENLHEIVNVQLAETDAKEVYDYGEGRPGTAEGRFMRPLLSRSPWQLNELNNAYIKKYGHPLADAIKKETTRDFEDILLARIKYAIDRPTFYAEVFHMALKGAGTKDCTLQRALVTRADIDLESIKAKYEELYGEPLAKAIEDDTSGDYRKLCLKLVAAFSDV